MEPNSPENLSGIVIDDFVMVENPEVEQSRLSSSSIENPNFVHVERDDNGDDDDVVEEQNSEVLSVKDEKTDNIEDDNGDDYGVDEERNSEVLSVESVQNEGSGNLEEIMRNVVVLLRKNANGDDCNVYLVGTSHVSKDPCQEVEAVISFIKPQVVFLELCSSQMSTLFIKDSVPTYSEIIDTWKNQQSVLAIVNSWYLAKIAEKLEVLPDCVFRVAFEEAMKCGSKVILGDRAINIAIQRMWNTMSLWHKTKLMFTLVFSGTFLPTGVIQKMSKQFPTLMETLINERDQYMTYTLFDSASEVTSVVAVFGKGRVQGIMRNWNQSVEIEEELKIPSPARSSMVKVLSAIGITVAGAAIVYGCFFASKKQS